MRNDMTHGRVATRSSEEKLRAMLTGQRALMSSVLSRLGYTGRVYNESTREN